LAVDIRDPHDDLEQLGARYCHGGYIWQVYDGAGRPLLAGPHYPDPRPAPFDGQGMPEAFRAPELVQPCEWVIERGDGRVVMLATQQSVKIRREVRVVGDCVESMTAVENISAADIAIEWFSHPFFPLNPDLTCGKITPPIIDLPDNAGYYVDAAGTVVMKGEYPWPKGLFQPIGVRNEKLTFDIPHPVVGRVVLSTDYDVAKCPIWANKSTFSFEPFIQRVIGPGEEASWKITLAVPAAL